LKRKKKKEKGGKRRREKGGRGRRRGRGKGRKFLENEVSIGLSTDPAALLWAHRFSDTAGEKGGGRIRREKGGGKGGMRRQFHRTDVLVHVSMAESERACAILSTAFSCLAPDHRKGKGGRKKEKRGEEEGGEEKRVNQVGHVENLRRRRA